jgi:peptidylprolyl isomerase
MDGDIENFYKKYSIILITLVLILGAGFFYLTYKPDKMEEVTKIAVIQTNFGEIRIELFLDESPITAGNFKKLIEEGYYDQVKFHRVMEGFMIQGGDPYSKEDTQMQRWGTGGPGYSIEDEFVEGLSNVRGTISMANSGPNSGGSQFFINTVDNTFLDWNKEPSNSKHPVFGKVIVGMDVVDEISNVDTDKAFNRPIEPVIIERAYME